MKALEPELIKLRGFVLYLLCLGFIGGNEDRLADVSKIYRDLFVERRDTGSRIDDPYDRLRAIYREPCLFEDVRRDDRLVIRDDAARVDQLETLRLPLDFAVDPVTGDPGLVADYRSPGTG